MQSLPKTMEPHATALFLDVDGTLLDLCDRPQDVAADAELIELLGRLSTRLGGALSLISGRSIADIDRIFAPARFPAAGSHGAEIRLHPDDEIDVTTAQLPASIMRALADFAQTHDGLLLERKNGGASLHYRMAPQLEAECRQLVDELLAGIEQEFRLIPGKMVFELAPRGHNKGNAIVAMMDREPFAGRRPVFVGDDVTDEDGFQAVNALHGISVRVGEDRDSAAACSFASVAAVRQWLKSMVE